MKSGKTIGIILMAAGLGICLLAALWAGVSAMGEGLSNAAAILGVGLAFLISAPLVGAGIFLFFRSRGEGEQLAYAQQERKLLGMVQTAGQMDIASASLELDVNRSALKEMVYDLVNKGFFAGYINWDEGMLYSRDASQLKDGSQCPNCRGELELVGKGVVSCPYCGTDIFLTE
ncbi:MAG: hypothetical protein U9Q70_03390 [Chloroflexota bacterium]|nr:hypothetical protein [Chloroflexota bacterium]